MTKLIGGCLCNNVRYCDDTDVILTVICHCKNCQKQNGSAFSTNIAVGRGTIQFEGELACYEDIGDSGETLNRYFCPNCGAGIYSEPEAIPDLTMLKAGTLDDTSWVNPTMEIYCDSSQGWLALDNQMKKFSAAMEP